MRAFGAGDVDADAVGVAEGEIESIGRPEGVDVTDVVVAKVHEA